MTITIDQLIQVLMKEETDDAGMRAVVRALRDEMDRQRGDDWRWGDTVYFFNHILGDAGNEKVAHVCDGDEGPSLHQTPATAHAPAVCVWEVDGRNLWFARCPKQMGHRSYSQPPSHCPSCKAPIKFTEAK